MAGIAELERFRKQQLSKLSKEDIEKGFESFFEDNEPLDLNFKKAYEDLRWLRGRKYE